MEKRRPQQRIAVLEIAREFARLRKGDHEMKRVRREQEIWEGEQEATREAELEKMRRRIERQKIQTRMYGALIRQEYGEGIKKREDVNAGM